MFFTDLINTSYEIKTYGIKKAANNASDGSVVACLRMTATAYKIEVAMIRFNIFFCFFVIRAP